MTQRKRVYSPSGEAFDVPDYSVGDLVLNKGFSQQKPEFNAAPAPAEISVVDVDPEDEVFDDEEDDGVDDDSDDEAVLPES